MNMESILAPDRVFPGIRASSKKRAIEIAAQKIAAALPQLDTGDVYRSLIEREKLGSTGLGNGVAIPHCRLATCKSITGGLFIFNESVDFSSPDDQPVRIMFVLLVPGSATSEHLSTLAMLAERLRDDSYRNSLIEAADSETLYRKAIGTPDQAADQLSGGQ